MLATMFYTMYFLVAMHKAIVKMSGPSTFIMKLEDTYNIDSCPVNFTLKLAIMFIWTWMRALQIDPKHGRPQRQDAGVLLRLQCLHARADVRGHPHALSAQHVNARRATSVSSSSSHWRRQAILSKREV